MADVTHRTTRSEHIERVSSFLALESRLLDSHQYAAWLELFSPSGVYWIPVDPMQTDPEAGLNIIFSDFRQLEDRVTRLTAGYTLSQAPPTRTVRAVSNIEVETLDDQRVRALAVLTVHERRRGQQQIHAARAKYLLSPSGDGWMIDLKHVVLLGSEEPLTDLSYLP